MKIAVLASNFIRIPPRVEDVPTGYSGAPEEVVYRIVEGLVKKGHQVTLFASGDSKTSAQLVSVTEKATSKDKSIGIGPHESYEYLLISKCYQMAKKGNFDIIHSNFDKKSAYFAPLVDIPTVSTLHSVLDKAESVLKFCKDAQYYVSISDAQRKPIPDLNYIGTVYHGLDISTYPFDSNGGNKMVFVGRILPEKGADQAIKVSQNLDKQLEVLGWAAKKNMNYYAEKIKPYVDGKKIFIYGFLSRKNLKQHLIKAKLLIFPIRWEEPFGLVMIEAMACGTPVVAYARGSVPEVIADGVTGFIVNSGESDKRGDWIIKKTGIEGLSEAVERIYSMSEEDYKKMRFACRKYVEKNFSVEKMIEEYEKIYRKLLNK